jgi:hypothetical protein
LTKRVRVEHDSAAPEAKRRVFLVFISEQSKAQTQNAGSREQTVGRIVTMKVCIETHKTLCYAINQKNNSIFMRLLFNVSQMSEN